MIGATLEDRYRIETPLNSGSADSYLARHIATTQPVVVQLFPLGTLAPPEVRQCFLRTAASLGALHHPCIARLRDAGVGLTPTGATGYLAWDYMDGHSLGDFCQRNGPLTPKLAEQIVRQGILALQFAHAQGFAQPELSASHVFLEQNSKGGVDLKLLGLGAYRLRNLPVPKSFRDTIMARIAEGRHPAGNGNALRLAPLPEIQPEACDPAGSAASIAAIIQTYLTPAPPTVKEVLARAASGIPDRRYPSLQAFGIAYETASQGGELVIREGREFHARFRRKLVPATAAMFAFCFAGFVPVALLVNRSLLRYGFRPLHSLLACELLVLLFLLLGESLASAAVARMMQTHHQTTAQTLLRLIPNLPRIALASLRSLLQDPVNDSLSAMAVACSPESRGTAERSHHLVREFRLVAIALLARYYGFASAMTAANLIFFAWAGFNQAHLNLLYAAGFALSFIGSALFYGPYAFAWYAFFLRACGAAGEAPPLEIAGRRTVSPDPETRIWLAIPLLLVVLIAALAAVPNH